MKTLLLLVCGILVFVVMSCSACNSKQVYPAYGVCVRFRSSKHSRCRRSVFSGVEREVDCSSIVEAYRREFPSILTTSPTTTTANAFNLVQRITYMNLTENGDGDSSGMNLETSTRKKLIPLALQMVLRKNLTSPKDQLHNEEKDTKSNQSHRQNQEKKLELNWTEPLPLDRILPIELGGSSEWYNLVVSSRTKRELLSSIPQDNSHRHSTDSQKQVNWKTVEMELLNYLNSNENEKENEESQVEYDVVLDYDQENPITSTKSPTGFLVCLRFPGTDKQEIIHYFRNQNQDE